MRMSDRVISKEEWEAAQEEYVCPSDNPDFDDEDLTPEMCDRCDTQLTVFEATANDGLCNYCQHVWNKMEAE